MAEFFANIGSTLRFVKVTDVIDVLIVAFLAYKIIGFIRKTRAAQLIKGVFLLLAVTYLSGLFNLYTLNWLLEGVLTLGAVALIIVFQPELRRGLEYIGRSRLFSGKLGKVDKSQVKQFVTAVVRAVDNFSSHKVGALIILERETMLDDVVETGTVVDAAVTEELLGNIFYEGAPLHDGAVIVRDHRLHAAGCVLPLTQSNRLSKDLGTRHRAGIGITEASDAVAIIVSEETGIISMSIDGRLTRFLDVRTVEKTLLNLYLNDQPGEDPTMWDYFKAIGDRLQKLVVKEKEETPAAEPADPLVKPAEIPESPAAEEPAPAPEEQEAAHE
ncbi:MAG: diadenylate cyclase CdaA [Firmicutes bacterium]|nr:diadenylate cyclase CdaA [Bacillota bacterium]